MCLKGEKVMYLIVGLGNPESDYSKTRHNMGFNVINKLSEKYGIEVNKSKFKGLVGNGIIEGEKVLLLKPQTFMNLSGESVAEVLNFYKLDPEEEMLVIFDDISLAPGNIRIRKKGSAGGHNGIKSIIAHTIHFSNFTPTAFFHSRMKCLSNFKVRDICSTVFSVIPKITKMNKSSQSIIF